MRHGFDQGEAGAHRAFGVVLARLRVAEIGQHAVAHVFGDEAALAFDGLSAAPVIGGDDGAQVLDLQSGRQRGRPDEVAEHDGKMTALGVVAWGHRTGARRDRQFGDGRQQLAPVAE
jgi:hypothetical protein